MALSFPMQNGPFPKKNAPFSLRTARSQNGMVDSQKKNSISSGKILFRYGMFDPYPKGDCPLLKVSLY